MINPIALIIPLLNYVLQTYPRIFNPFFGVDVWTRLLEIDQVKKSGHRIPKKELAGQFIISGYFDYPPVFPFVLSYFPKKFLLRWQGFIAPLFDVAQLIFLFLLARYLTGSVTVGLLAQLFYALTPMLAIENSYLTPRSLGYFNLSLAVIPLLLFMYIHNPAFLVIGFIFSVFIFLTHRFAAQSFLFTTLIFTFVLNTPLFIQVFLLAFATATAITGGYYLRVLKGHLNNIYFWVCNLDYRFAHQVRGVITAKKQTDWVGQIYNLMSIFSPIAVFGLNPWIVSGFVVLGMQYGGMMTFSSLFLAFAWWIVGFYAFATIVLKVKYLMPIGEGQRYLEMVAVPATLLSGYLVMLLLDSPWRALTLVGVAVACLGVLATIVFIQIKGIIKDKNRSLTADLSAVFKFINKMPKAPRVICVPHQNTTLLLYHTKAQVLVNADNPGLLKIQDWYPILRKSIKQLGKEYKLTHVLVRESFVSLKEIGLVKKNAVFSSGDVHLIKL